MPAPLCINEDCFLLTRRTIKHIANARSRSWGHKALAMTNDGPPPLCRRRSTTHASLMPISLSQQRAYQCIVFFVMVHTLKATPIGQGYQLLDRPPEPLSFHIVIPTIGRREVMRMVNSVVPQLEPRDHLTVVYDGRDEDDTLPAMRDRMERANATVRLLMKRTPKTRKNKYGEAVRQACKKLAGDFVVFADDDDFFVPDALNTYRAVCNDTSQLYIFQMMRLFDGIKVWSTPNVTWSNIGSPMGVIPSWLNDLGYWPDKHSGDFDFYKSLLPFLGSPPQFVERVTYIVTNKHV